MSGPISTVLAVGSLAAFVASDSLGAECGAACLPKWLNCAGACAVGTSHPRCSTICTLRGCRAECEILGLGCTKKRRTQIECPQRARPSKPSDILTPKPSSTEKSPNLASFSVDEEHRCTGVSLSSALTGSAGFEWALVQQHGEDLSAEAASSSEFARLAEADVAAREFDPDDSEAPQLTLVAHPPRGTMRCIHARMDFETKPLLEGDLLLSGSVLPDGSFVDVVDLPFGSASTPQLFDWVIENGHLISEDEFNNDALKFLAWISFEADERDSLPMNVYHFSSVIACEVENPKEEM